MPKAVNGRKECSSCHKVKPISEFNKDKNRSDYLSRYCKQCCNEYSKEWRKNNKNYHQEWSQANPGVCSKIVNKWKKNNPQYYYSQTYGLTNHEAKVVQKIVKTSRCAICGIEAKNIDYGRRKKMLFIDHCHNSQEVRGLLCDKCNRGLGYFNDDIDLLKKAIKYIENPPGL